MDAVKAKCGLDEIEAAGESTETGVTKSNISLIILLHYGWLA